MNSMSGCLDDPLTMEIGRPI